VTELAEQHGDKLAPRTETSGMALGLGLIDQILEFQAGKKL
jgi:hypothetical protein